MIVFSVYTSVLKSIRENKKLSTICYKFAHQHKNAPVETGAFFIVLIREKILDLTIMIVFVVGAS